MKDLIEIWRPVLGYEGLYEVSDQGRIKSLSREIKCYGGVRYSKEKCLKPSKNSSGYYLITLSKADKKKNHYLHKIVARAFPEICGEWFEGCEVNHINENKLDCRAVNLEHVTKSQNINHATRNKRVAEKLSIPFGKYTSEFVLLEKYPSMAEAERVNNYVKGFLYYYYKNKMPYNGFYWMAIK